MIVGIGVDLVKVDRIARILNGKLSQRFQKRIMNGKTHQNPFFVAAKWAAKEAAFKAVFPTAKLNWNQVSIEYSCGKPHIVFEKDVNLIPHLSISHDGEYVIATVVVESS